MRWIMNQIFFEFLEVLLALIDQRIIQVEAKLKTARIIVNEPSPPGYEKSDALNKLAELKGLLAQ